jgi:cold shock CspA family protein
VASLVRHRMRVFKYVPTKLYGFVVDADGAQIFFHIRAFKWGSFGSSPPPIIGEEVDVEYDPDLRHNGQAPKAKFVYRVQEPVAACGVVEDFNEDRGYGFIKTTDGRSHYLHRSEMTDGRLPLPGTEVTFFEGFRQGRTRACYVTLATNGERKP